MTIPLILASASNERLRLLKTLYITPDQIISTDVDETPLKKEQAKDLAIRLAIKKAEAAALSLEQGYILAADTVVAVGRRILPKALTDEDVKYCLDLISGSRHRVYTGLCLIKKSSDKVEIRTKLCCTIVKFKRLSKIDIDFYLKCQQGIGKAGGYGVFGVAESFIEKMMGTPSNIAGLPLLEVRHMLLSMGFDKFNN